MIYGDNAKKGYLTLIDQGVFSIANFLTGVIIGRVCTKEQFGLYILGLTIVTFIMEVQGHIINTPYMIFSPRLKGDEHRRYTGSTMIHQFMLSGLIMLLLAMVIVLVPSDILPNEFDTILLTLIGVISLILLREYTRRVSFANLQMKTALILDTSVSIIQIGGLLALAYFGLLTPSTAYLIIGFACGTISLIWVFNIRKDLLIKINHSFTDLKQNWRAGKWIFASGLLWSIAFYLYPWVLVSFHGPEANGILGACQAVVALFNPVFLGMQNFFTPKIAHSFAEGGISYLRNYTKKATGVFTAIMTLCALFLILFGDFLTTSFYGEKYSGNGLVVSVLALNLLSLALAFSYSRALYAVEKTVVDFKINIIPMVLLFTAGIWLVKEFGPLGTALGLLAGNFIALGFRYAAFNKYVPVKS